MTSSSLPPFSSLLSHTLVSKTLSSFPHPSPDTSPLATATDADGNTMHVTQATPLGADESFVSAGLFQATLCWPDADPSVVYEVVVKLAPSDTTEVGQLLAPWDLHLREITFFQTIPQQVSALHTPAFVAASDDLLVLEFDTERVSIPLLPGLTLPQAHAVLRQLGALHASTRSRSPPEEWHFQGNAQSAIRETQAMLWDLAQEQLPTLLGSLLPDDALATLSAFSLDDMHHDADKYLCEDGCIVHGDLFANNCLFLPNNEEDDGVLIDAQFAGWGVDVADVAFLLLSSVPHSVLEEHQASLLDTYAKHSGRSPDAYDTLGLRMGAVQLLMSIDIYSAFTSPSDKSEVAARVLHAINLLH